MSMFYFYSSYCSNFSINLLFFFWQGQSDKIIVTLKCSFWKLNHGVYCLFLEILISKLPIQHYYAHMYMWNTFRSQVYNLNLPFTRLNRRKLELGQVFLISKRVKEQNSFERDSLAFHSQKLPITSSKFSSLYFIKRRMNHLQTLSKMIRNTKATAW